MSVLPYVSPALRLSCKVAVVGSSGALTGANLGENIDSHEEVVRFNRAPTLGYENDVGAKVTLRVVNNHVFDNMEIASAGYSNSPKDFVKNLRNSNILYIGPPSAPWERRHQNTHKSNQLFKFDYSCISNLKNTLNCNFGQNLLIGTIFIALCIEAGIVPTIFGFDLAPTPRTHYWQSRPTEVNNNNHNPWEEQNILKSLIKQSLIKIENKID